MYTLHVYSFFKNKQITKKGDHSNVIFWSTTYLSSLVDQCLKRLLVFQRVLIVLRSSILFCVCTLMRQTFFKGFQ